MSTAWYRSNVIPTCIRRWTTMTSSSSSPSSLSTLLQSIEVWDTTCVVTNFGSGNTTHSTTTTTTSTTTTEDTTPHILINPANPNLSGVSDFPYFPKGGPQPSHPPGRQTHPIMGYVTQWGGMEVGQGMMFPAMVVDGLVHQMGGKRLQLELSTHQHCKEGDAIWTSAPGMEGRYQGIVHTVPPFYEHCNYDMDNDDDPKDLLRNCYRNSLQLIRRQQENCFVTEENNNIRVAAPLLGAGCRGFPLDVAIDVAASTLVEACLEEGEESSSSPTSVLSKQQQQQHHRPTNVTLAFAIPSGEIRESLVDAIDTYWNQYYLELPTTTDMKEEERSFCN